MEISLNKGRELFLIKHHSGVTCLGFDVVYRTLKELAARLRKAGLAFSEPVRAARGTLQQYEAYQQALAAYSKLQDQKTWFTEDTPEPVQKVLEAYRLSGKTLRVFYGGADGVDWLEEYETIGKVGRSTGPLKVPLLVPKGENGGSAILAGSIIRLVDVASGKELYRAANYSQPTLVIGDSGTTHKGYVAGVWSTKQGEGEAPVNLANFKSYAKAAAYLAFITGEIHVVPK